MKNSLSRLICLLSALLALMILFPLQAGAADHTVKPGESLFIIGKKYGVSQADLKRINGLSSDVIYPGQVIKTTATNRYTVKKGDTLFIIASKHGTTYQAIMNANGLKNSSIHPGQTLNIPSATPGVSRGSTYYSKSDIDLLARIITAEADSESFKTQVAVGAVVLNRVKSSLFPDTIPGVVYQVESGRYQFEPVLNGWINRPASASGKRAAAEALAGVDPSNGSLYFFESWVTNKFLRARPVSVVLDSFTFTY